MFQPSTRVPSQGILTFESVGAYTGIQLSNHTGRTIYIMGVDGIVHDLVSRPSYSYIKDPSPKICVRVDARYNAEPAHDGNVHPMNTAAGRYDDIYITTMGELYTANGLPTAVYLPQANVSVSLVPDTNLLRQAHPYFAPAIKTDDCEFSRLMINLHDTSKQYMYVAGSHGVSKVMITHDVTKPELIRFRVRDEFGALKQYRLDITDTTDVRCIDIGYDRFGLVMGIAPEIVRSRFDELHNGPKRELVEVKKVLENTNRELEITKNENIVLKRKVSDVVNRETEVHELNALKMKAEIADAEYAKTKAHIEADKENIPIKMQRESQKAETDLAVAQAKLATAESDNNAQAWKSTAVVAGAAATMGVIATKLLTTSAAAGVAGIAGAAVVAPAAAVAVLGMGAATLLNENVREAIANTFKAALRGSCSLFNSCVDSTTSCVKKAVQTVSDCGKAIFRTGVNVAKSVVSGAVSAVKSVGSAVSGAARSVCRTVRRWFS